MTTREKGLLLTGLLLVWGALMLTDGDEQENQQYQPSTTPGVQAKHGSKPVTFGFDKPLQTIALNTPRNIFAPLRNPNQPKPQVAKRPPEPKTPTLKPQPSRPAPVKKQQPATSSTSLAAQQARQQLKKYQFLGYLTKAGEKQIFLSNGQAIYIVKQGEMLEGDIQVKSIEPTAVVLSKHLKSIGETVEATLPLTKDGKKT